MAWLLNTCGNSAAMASSASSSPPLTAPPVETLGTAHRLLAENALRAQEQHKDKRRVKHRHRPGRLPDVHQGLQYEHEDRRGEGAADTAQAAEDDDGQQPGDQVVAAVGVEVVGR